MYIYKPTQKVKDGKIPILDGEYLLLMRPKTTLALMTPMPLRAIVRHVRMEAYTVPCGSILVAKQKLLVFGDYGLNGLPMTVQMDVYQEGFPLNPELFELWNRVPEKHGGERKEMELWGRSLLQYQRGKGKPGVCYRCEKPYDGELLSPCPDCAREISAYLEALLNHLPDALRLSNKKPPALVIRPNAIQSQENF